MKRLYDLALADLRDDATAEAALAAEPGNWYEVLGQIKNECEIEVTVRRAEKAALLPPPSTNDGPLVDAYRVAANTFRRWHDGQLVYIKRIEVRQQHAKALHARAHQAQQRERSALRIEQRLYRVEELLGITEHQEWSTYHERLLRVERVLAERDPLPEPVTQRANDRWAATVDGRTFEGFTTRAVAQQWVDDAAACAASAATAEGEAS